MTFTDTAMKRDAVLEALPTHSDGAVSIRDLELRLGFPVRAHLEMLYVRRRADRRQESVGSGARWLWWRL